MSEWITLRLSVNSKTPIKAILTENISEYYNIWGGSIDSWRNRCKTPSLSSVNSQVYYLILGCYN